MCHHQNPRACLHSEKTQTSCDRCVLTAEFLFIQKRKNCVCLGEGVFLSGKPLKGHKMVTAKVTQVTGVTK